MFGNATSPVNLIAFVLDGAAYLGKWHVLCSDNRISLDGVKSLDPSL